jgi:hypothetical protein
VKRALFLSFLLAFVSSVPVAAQSGDAAAYLALTTTPTAAFAPIASPVRFGEMGGGAVSFRYGQLSLETDHAIHHWGLTADFPASTGRVGVTLGAATCDGCDALIMLGADWAKPLVRRSSDEGAVGIGLASALGLGLPTTDGDGFLLSGSLGLSFSAVGGKAGGPRIIPYVTPGVGFGTLTGDDGASGIRPMVAGGLGFAAANGFGASAGFQHVPLEGGQMVVGVAVTIGGR